MIRFSHQSRRARLWAMVLGALFFTVTLGLLVAWSIRSATGDLEQVSLHKLSLYQQILTSEIQRHQFLPFALARNQNILGLLGDQHNSRRLAEVNRYLEEVSSKTSSAAVYLLNTDGLTLASSNWRSEKSYVGQNYGFRPYFQAALRGEAGRYFAIGATTLTPGLFLSYPVEIEGRVIGVVALKVALDPLEASWAEQPAEKVLVSDGNGVIIASSEPNWKFRTLQPLPLERRRQLRQSRQFVDADLLPLGVSPVDWLPTRQKCLRIATPPRVPTHNPFRDLGLAATYLDVQMPMADSDWTLHLLAEMSPVGRRLVNTLGIFGPTALALALLIFYLIEHRFYTRERNQYQARAKAELESSEAQKRAIIQSARAALVTIDEAGVIEAINPTAETYFGYPAGEVSGQNLKQLLFPADHAAIDDYLAAARRERSADFPLETRGRRRDGSPFFIDLNISDLYPHPGYRFLVTIHNITKRKNAEDQLRRALEEQDERIRERTCELEASNRLLQHEVVERQRAEAILRETQNDLIQAGKLAALGQLSAGITHELNQPLAAIRTFSASGTLLLERGMIEPAKENFNRIQELTERMAKLTSQLKTFARKSRGDRQPISVRQAIQQSLDLLANQLSQQRIEIDLHLPDEAVQVIGDQVRLEQVVINLISNALDAMRDRPRRRLGIDYRLDRQWLWLTVEDSGGGIPDELVSQIFDPFFTTKEVGQGLGLGLSITYGIVKDWGGTLSVNNGSDGACFTLQLPRSGGAKG